MRYGVTGVPDVRFDGVRSFVGAGTCEEQVALYRGAVQDALRGEAWLSPVAITGSLRFEGTTATIEATLELVEPGTFPAHQATVFLVEDQVEWCCGWEGQDVWDGVVRMVRSTPVSLTTLGETAFVSESVDVTGFVPENLHPVVVFEETAGTRYIVQASDLRAWPHFFVASFPELVGSTPDGGGTVEFSGTLYNVGEFADTIQLTLDDGFGWVSEIVAQGGTGTPTEQTVTLGAGESAEILLRVTPEGAPRVGRGTLSLSSFQAQHTQRVEAEVFHGTPSLRLVTDAGPGSSEVRFEQTLTELDRPFDSWVTRRDGPPGVGLLRGYDAVIWQTALLTGNLLSPREESTLRAYLDAGGGLFLSSMGLVGSRTMGDPFLADYLGVVDWTNDVGATEGNGVPGDPITDGLALTFQWGSPEQNDVDALVTAPGAWPILMNESGATIGVRTDVVASGRTLFTSFYMNAIPEEPIPPDGFALLVDRGLDWLVERDVSSVPEGTGSSELPVGPAASDGVASLSVVPTPFAETVTIEFRGDPDLGSDPYPHFVRLEIFDIGGRRVRTLAGSDVGRAGRAPFGERTASSPGRAEGSIRWHWDGRDARGVPVPPGLYLARPALSGGGGSGGSAPVQKLIRVG